MSLLNIKFVSLMGVLAIGGSAVPAAHAGCGQYRPSSLKTVPSLQLKSSLIRVGLQDEESEVASSIVGTWKEHWISEGSEGIPDGTEVDAGYSQWHSDGTEENVSGLRAPLSGDVCFGEWKKVGPRDYQLNHFGISYDPTTGQKLIGPAHIKQWLCLDEKGMTTSGKFTIDQYDEAGNLLAHVQGKIIGTRVTMETGFEKVE